MTQNVTKDNDIIDSLQKDYSVEKYRKNCPHVKGK